MSRAPLDRYDTPADLAARIVAELPIRPGDTVLEPSVGGGAFVGPLLARGAGVWACDINPEAEGLALVGEGRSVVGDFREWDKVRPAAWPRRFDWVLGNPPFREADAHVCGAFEVGRRVCFVLRSTWAGSGIRGESMEAMPAERVWLPAPRPSFTPDGKTDGAPPLVFLWRVGASSPGAFGVLHWRAVAKKGRPLSAAAETWARRAAEVAA